jgi:LacI family transcriptional regulator
MFQKHHDTAGGHLGRNGELTSRGCGRTGLLKKEHAMVTLKQIANAVGVSTATVSRVLNFDTTLSITAGKRQAIIEAAEAMNYATPRNRNRANQQGLNRLALVHFLSPDQELVDPYYVGLRLGIERRCQALKIETVKVYHTQSLPDASVLQSASGVIAIGAHSDHEISWLKAHSRHLVFADFAPVDGEFDGVLSDLALATRKLLGALQAMGYNRLGFIGWAEDDAADPFGEVRCRTFIDWMKQRALFDPALCLTERSIERNTERTGYDLACRMLDSNTRPEAIVTCNDNIAVGVYRALHEAGLRIPNDVAIASFNDISVAQFMNPPLSTVHLPSEEIGETAVELLLERISGRELAKRITLAAPIIWRGSTPHPPASH